MASLDVDSLFSNIPLKKTVNVCCDSLFGNDAKANNNRIDFGKPLKIKVIFKSVTRITSFLKFKDKLLYCLCPNVLYKFSCVRWNATYYGETCRHLRVGVDENSGVPPLTGKKSKSRKSTTVKDHMLFCDPLMTLKFWEPVTQISMLKSKKLFHYHVANSS